MRTDVWGEALEVMHSGGLWGLRMDADGERLRSLAMQYRGGVLFFSVTLLHLIGHDEKTPEIRNFSCNSFEFCFVTFCYKWGKTVTVTVLEGWKPLLRVRLGSEWFDAKPRISEWF